MCPAGSKISEINIILLEDHPLYRDGLENFISKKFSNAKFIYSGDDFMSAKNAITSSEVNLAIVDLHLGDNRPPMSWWDFSPAAAFQCW